MTRRLLWLLAPLVTLGLLAAPVWADTYTDDLAGRFGAQSHVVADPAAHPTLSDPGRINRTIVDKNLPIYVAVVAPPQTGITTPDALYAALTARVGHFSGILLIIDSKGYHVRAFNVNQRTADSVDGFMGSSAKEHKGDPQGAVEAFVAKIDGLRGGPQAAASSSEPTDWTWLWVTLIVVAGIGLLAALAWALSRWIRHQTREREREEQLRSDLIAAESKVNDLGQMVLNGDEVADESLKAHAALADAKDAMTRKDYVAARAHLGVVATAAGDADYKINPTHTPDWSAVAKTPRRRRKQATVQAQHPVSGERVLIDNADYRRNRESGYPYYWAGGQYNNVYFFPGYYPTPFYNWGWDPTSVTVTDTPLRDYTYDGSRQRFDDDLRDHNEWRTTSDQSNVGFSGERESSSKSVTYDYSGLRRDDSSSSSSSSSSWDFGGSSSGFSGGDYGGSSSSGGSDYGF